MNAPNNNQAAEGGRGPGWPKMLAGLLGIVAYCVLGWWLMEQTTWVETCRPGGRNIAYMISALSCSPGLLKQGLAGLGLFAWLWAMPVAIVVGIILPALKRRRPDPISSPQSSE